MKQIIQIGFYLLLISCKQDTNSNSITRIKESNIKTIFNKPINLVFIWTTWCGVSKSILSDTYTQLQKDSNQYNIIIICGNDDEIGIENKLNDLQFKKYVISNATDYFPFIDRLNIKDFITTKFKNTNDIKLEGSFGIPISILVDSSLNVLNSNMPQDTLNIHRIINDLKK